MATAGIEDTPERDPPRRRADLPAPQTGLAPVPELHEFEQLERDGWLAQMLADYRCESGSSSRSSSGLPYGVPHATPARPALLSSDRQAPGHALLARWADRLQATMARMDDSRAEC